jgi:hypothetical protein
LDERRHGAIRRNAPVAVNQPEVKSGVDWVTIAEHAIQVEVRPSDLERHEHFIGIGGQAGVKVHGNLL